MYVRPTGTNRASSKVIFADGYPARFDTPNSVIADPLPRSPP